MQLHEFAIDRSPLPPSAARPADAATSPSIDVAEAVPSAPARPASRSAAVARYSAAHGPAADRFVAV